MDKEVLDKLNEYLKYNKSKVYALNNWLKLNVKPFKIAEALKCVYDAANGNFKKMDDIIAHLTAKQKTYGRTQVYADQTHKNMDITMENGRLVLKGYENPDTIPLKGQKVDRNPNIFRKSDDQVKKTYQNTEKKIYDIGKEVRNMWPKAVPTFISLAIVAVRRYASEKKIHTDKVIDGLKKHRLALYDETFRIVPVLRNESKTFIIGEREAKMLIEELQMTEYKFYNAIKAFLHDLLVDPINAKPSYILATYGYNRHKLLAYLIKYNIIEKEEKILDKDENGKPRPATMKVKYKVPKLNFDRKLKKLYIRLFERNIPQYNMDMVSEEGEAGGATGSDASGQYSQPVFPIQRREIYGNANEATTTSTIGDYQYDAPIPGDDETLKRNNGVGGSTSVQIAENN